MKIKCNDKRRVLQIVDDLQHHVGSEELAEASARVGAEAASERRAIESRGVEIGSAKANSCFLVEGLRCKTDVELFVPKKQTARLRVDKNAQANLREAALLQDHALDGHRCFGRVVAAAEETRDMRLPYCLVGWHNAHP